MPTLTEILKSINLLKDKDLIHDWNEAEYPAWVVNRAMSFHPDVVLLANEMNMRGHIDKKMQYKYYLYAVRKKARFSPWLKFKAPADIEVISEYYKCSKEKAADILPLLSEDDLKKIKKILDKGGVKDD